VEIGINVGVKVSSGGVRRDKISKLKIVDSICFHFSSYFHFIFIYFFILNLGLRVSMMLQTVTVT